MKPLPAKVEAQLRTGGVEWGVQDHLLVFSTVNKQFVNFPITHLSRFGQSETLSLPAGDYRVTGIGLEANFGFNVLKLLDKGAFVNEDATACGSEPALPRRRLPARLRRASPRRGRRPWAG